MLEDEKNVEGISGHRTEKNFEGIHGQGTSPRVIEGAEISKGVWSQQEHDLFLEAMQIYPRGSWRAIANHVGTRSARQVQTHAQKYNEKVARRLRGLRKYRKQVVRPEHRIDNVMLQVCNDLHSDKETRQSDSRVRKQSSGEPRDDTTNETTTAFYISTSQVENVGNEIESRDRNRDVGIQETSDDGLQDRSSGDDALASLCEYIDYLFDALSSSDSEHE